MTEILDTSSAVHWRHIPGELNQGYDGSRKFSAAFVTPQDRWLRGPDLLLMPEVAWPPPIGISEPLDNYPDVSPAEWMESIRIPILHRIFSLVQKSSDLIHLKRVIAWLLHFLRNYSLSRKHALIPRVRWLTAPEIRDSLVLLTRVNQEHNFLVKIRFLRQTIPRPTTSKVASLTYASYIRLKHKKTNASCIRSGQLITYCRQERR